MRRLISISISTCLSILIVYLYSRYHSNKSWIQLLLSFRLRKLKIKDVVWPLIITATIFLGPIIDEIFTRRWFEYHRLPAVWHNRPNIWTFLRNWLLGPLLEEIVFRCINCTLLANDLPTHYTVIISGLLFGAAHFHPQIMQHVFLDMERQILIESIIQFFYTSAFGMYVATIFMKTRSLWPAAAVHIFCNAMGLPSGNIFRGNWMKLATTSGIAAWLLLYSNYLMAEAA